MSTTAEESPAEPQVARAQFDRIIAETRKFSAEQNKLAAEQSKLAAGAAKLNRDRFFAPFVVATPGSGLLAAIVTRLLH